MLQYNKSFYSFCVFLFWVFSLILMAIKMEIDYDHDDCEWGTSYKLKMVTGSFYIPKYDESKPLGEDALFISEDEQTIGLADGVGSWSKKGIDAGEYARELMKNAEKSIQEQAMEYGTDDVNPKQALHEAFLNTKAKGSSTACIITLKGDYLSAVNLGDSGFMVIRNGKVDFLTNPQQSGFNKPYQIGPESKRKPDDAQELMIDVERGDIVVAGTDGLFDNLFPREIEFIVRFGLRENHSPAEMASCIAQLARAKSESKEFITPFSKSAVAAGRNEADYKGGKYDDVSVIVAFIQQ